MLIPGLSKKKFITILVVAFFILICGGCLQYCAKASNSLKDGTPKTGKGDQEREHVVQKPERLPTPFANNVLADFPNDVKKDFQYVILIKKSAWGDFLNGRPLDTSGYIALSGKEASLSAKQLITSDIEEDRIIVTPEFIGRVFDGLGENWYLDWDGLRHTFRPLTIRLRDGLPKSSLQSIFTKVLENSKAQSLANIHPKRSGNFDTLPENLETFLERVSKDEGEKNNFEPIAVPSAEVASKDSGKESKGWLERIFGSSEYKKDHGGLSPVDRKSKQSAKWGGTSEKKQKFYQEGVVAKISPGLKQRLVFISSTPVHGCYVIFYLKDNNYGKLLLHRKIGWNPNGQAIVMTTFDLVNVLSSLFEVDPPTVVINDQKLKTSVDAAMTTRKEANGKLNEKERKKIRALLTAEMMNQLRR